MPNETPHTTIRYALANAVDVVDGIFLREEDTAFLATSENLRKAGSIYYCYEALEVIRSALDRLSVPPNKE